MKVEVEVSARHIHLSIKDCLVLFGKSELTARNSLSQKGEFASEEVVELVGPKKSLHKVRVLGPLRDKSQVEISRSDALSVGIDAPLAISGQGVGAEIKVVGPHGTVQSDIAMVAKRHFHLCPETAHKLKLKSDKMVGVKIHGERSTIFENVVVRVSEKFVDRIHLDTDEGNASGLDRKGYGELILY